MLLMLLPVMSFSQFVEQNRESPGEQIFLTPSIAIPAEEAGYTLILPDDKNAKGLIVFFNADRDTTSKIFRDAIRRNIGVMFVSTGNRLEFFFNDSRMLQIEEYLQDVTVKYGLPKNGLMFVGMSLAGTRAIKMALFSGSASSKYHFIPRCIAVCDAPLDFVRFWHEMDRAKRLKATPVTANEGEWVTGYLEANLHGTPSTRLDAYLKYSPYSHTQVDSTKLGLLKRVTVRAYTEPDVQWWMKTRKKDYYSMNSLDLAGFVNDLNILGNADAELIITHDKGYLPDGTRHPHSWSIVDEGDLVDWFEKSIPAR
jgi:hypothetical protein